MTNTSLDSSIESNDSPAVATSQHGAVRRLLEGETAFNFFGRRNIAFGVSGLLLVVTLVSMIVSGLNLGLDFKGGVAWQVPETETMNVAAARQILASNDIRTDNAKVQLLQNGSDKSIRLQVGDVPAEVRDKVVSDLASTAGVSSSDVSVSAVSSSWGRSITEKAVRALIIFLGLIAVYLAWRFESRMAIAALLAMIHDVIISVGVYSVFGFEVTPATVVAFLTILGYSLYDTIVVFDRVQDNVSKFSGSKMSMGDISNISMNQVLMRSLNTSISSILPVLSILIIGTGVLGAVSLKEFAIALLVGMVTGSYSSIFTATPLLTLFKQRESKYQPYRGQLMSTDELRHMVITGNASTRVRRRFVSPEVGTEVLSPTAVLNHPPRPRKKKRR